MSHRPDHEAPDPGPHGSDPEDLRAELAALGAPPMPADVTARIGAVLAEEMRVGPGPDRADPRGPRPRFVGGRPGRPGTVRRPARPARAAAGRARPAVLAGLVAAAVVAVAAAVVTLGAAPAPRVVSEEGDLRSAGVGAVGEQGAGPLAGQARRRACLRAADVPEPEAPLLGARAYPVRGEPGTLLVLGTEVRGRFRLVVVDPACGPGGGRLLASTTAGR